MKKKLIIIFIIILITTISLFVTFKIIEKRNEKEITQELDKKKKAKISVTTIDNLEFEFLSKIKVSDLITSINGEIVDDYEIDTTKVGEKKVEFNFINEDNIEVEYKIDINIVDTTPPLIWCYENYTVYKGNEFDYENILCADNYDEDIKCSIEGNYNINELGTYPLKIKATDSSGNESVDNINLKVINPPTTKPSTPSNNTSYRISFEDVVKKYKNDKTKIGLDVSEWQGEIDFESLKNNGVEFIILRIGGSKGTNKEYFLDKYFTYNIEQANKYGIDVGVYFFSYADTVKHAKKDALWVVEQLKEYDINLPIAFDWENWRYFNSYGLSFYELTSMADTFINVVEDAGYEGMLYSSIDYLKYMWLPNNYTKWIAYYGDNPPYDEKYKYWQICDTGKIEGIKGPVDINIMYKD